MKSDRNIVVVIVNYRTPHLTVECLKSISADRNNLAGVRVVVVDNNSGDDSLSFIEETINSHGWHDWIMLLPLPENGGFAYGNNRAIESIVVGDGFPDYIWLLNPDTIVRQGACLALASFLDEHPEVGIAGSRLEDPDGSVQVSAFRDHSVTSEFLSAVRLGILSKLLKRRLVARVPIPANPVQTDWVSGASMMIREQVFKDVGLLDEKFFMYFEEVDFCLRARQKGWPCWYVPESRVVHLVGKASGIVDYRRRASRRPAYWFASRRRFFLKHFGKTSTFLADTVWMIGFVLWRLRRPIQGKPDNDPPHFLRDFFAHSVYCKGFRL